MTRRLLRHRPHVAWLVAIAALLFAATGSALGHGDPPQVRAHKFKKPALLNPSEVRQVAKYLETHDKQLRGRTGPTGPTGAQGTPGTDGVSATAPLASGASESGVFSVGGGVDSSGYVGVAINYQHPLPTAVADTHVIDTDLTPNPTDCPGPGQAARGYLCLYPQEQEGVGSTLFVASTDGPMGEVAPSVGVSIYFQLTGGDPYSDGVWTVTAS